MMSTDTKHETLDTGRNRFGSRGGSNDNKSLHKNWSNRQLSESE